MFLRTYIIYFINILFVIYNFLLHSYIIYINNFHFDSLTVFEWTRRPARSTNEHGWIETYSCLWSISLQERALELHYSRIEYYMLFSCDWVLSILLELFTTGSKIIMVVSGISCPETILNKKSSRGDMSVRISHISKID